MDRIKVKKIVAHFIIRKKYYSTGNEQIDLIHKKVNKKHTVISELKYL